jgi:DNA modification methylase
LRQKEPSEYHKRTNLAAKDLFFRTSKNDNSKQYVNLELTPNMYLAYGLLSDYFQEPVRMKARRRDDISPRRYWFYNEEKIKAQTSNPVEQRDLIRQGVKECTQFNPEIMIGLIKLFHMKKVLDFCAGWGDRLAGCIALDHRIQKYTGIDANKELFNGYKKMIKQYLPKHSRSKYEMICGDAVDVLPTINDMYDAVITCPPYFDKEIYNHDESQSIYKYPENWVKDFLVNAMGLAFGLLKDGGHMIICISGFEQEVLDKVDFMAYRGLIKCGDMSLMVWCKE